MNSPRQKLRLPRRQYSDSAARNAVPDQISLRSILEEGSMSVQVPPPSSPARISELRSILRRKSLSVSCLPDIEGLNITRRVNGISQKKYMLVPVQKKRLTFSNSNDSMTNRAHKKLVRTESQQSSSLDKSDDVSCDASVDMSINSTSEQEREYSTEAGNELDNAKNTEEGKAKDGEELKYESPNDGTDTNRLLPLGQERSPNCTIADDKPTLQSEMEEVKKDGTENISGDSEEDPLDSNESIKGENIMMTPWAYPDIMDDMRKTNAQGSDYSDDDVFGENGSADDDLFDKGKKCFEFNGISSDSALAVTTGLYGLLMVITGAVIPIAEVYVTNDSPTILEAFYIYLFAVAIAFLAFVYIWLLHRSDVETLTQGISKVSLKATKFIRKGDKSEAEGENSRRRHVSSAVSVTSSVCRRRGYVYDEKSNHHTGSFYLRLGAVAFGIGSLIHSGLYLGEFFAMHNMPEHCTDTLRLMKPVLHMLFILGQLYFIFKHSKLVIFKHKALARFGFMHMSATNICVWFRSIVLETLHSLHEYEAEDHSHNKAGHGHVARDVEKASHYNDSGNFTGTTVVYLLKTVGTVGKLHNNSGLRPSELPELDCHWSETMGKIVQMAGPYLYPLTIEYSLICAGILFAMWENVGKRSTRIFSSGDSDDDEEVKTNQRMSVDCASSSRGLFLGLVLFVAAIISITAFEVLYTNERYDDKALELSTYTQIIASLIGIVAVTLAGAKMRNLLFVPKNKDTLEETLILLAVSGLYIFGIFSIIAAIFSRHEDLWGELIIREILSMIQATLQSLFMMASMRMCARNLRDERRKPGREIVTFLLVLNFSMWIMVTFETQRWDRNPIQMRFYGTKAWVIFTRISVPLAIFYRFHSTVCLSHVWKKAWKWKRRMSLPTL